MNAVLSSTSTVEQYEGITWRISTKWCVLSGLQNYQHKGYPSACGFLTYSMEYFHHHNYKLNSRHIMWTSYMVMI